MRAVRNCLLLVPAILPSAVASSHHSRRYAAYDYDLTTPQYTPDGRLLQVEYATNACIREDSNPIVSVGVSMPGGGDTILIMATISSPPPSTSLSTTSINPSQKGSTDGQEEQPDENEIKSFTKGAHQRTQFRIIEIPLSTSNHCSSLHHTSTSTVLVGLSGLLSDATSLLRIVYSHLEEEQRMFGWHRLGLSPVGTRAVDDSDPSNSAANSLQPSRGKQSQSITAQPSETVLRLSRAIADKCQTHAFGGGLRPLGASLLLAGVDICPDTIEKGDNARQKHGARMAMCETHPNGGWRSHVSTEKSNESNFSMNSPQIMVTGGPAKSQSRLKSLINSRLLQLYEEVGNSPKNTVPETIENNIVEPKGKDYETLFLRQVLQTTLSSLVEEWKKRGDPHLTSSTASSGTAKHGQEQPGQQQLTLPQMEVVIASPTRGTFRLTEIDVARLMRPSVINS